MQAFNLKTASTYLNNLLLARGLLRDGQPIEFARPSKAEGGAEVTMAHIINLVHDMILQKDREQERRETLAQTLRTLSSESTHHAATIERLEARNEELSRQLSLAQSQERSAKQALRSAEATIKSLREDAVRLKQSVQQIRASCANDVRKRDVQIQRLKTHLTEQQRGNKTGMVGASITISPGMGGAVGRQTLARNLDEPKADLQDPAYSLQQETTEFLTQLSQSLSDENDCLIGLVRETLATLRELQGLPDNAQRAQTDSANGGDKEPDDDATKMLHVLPTSCENLSQDMQAVLANVRAILTSPNFVSIEEVHARDEEILKLREAWERMESRWREALTLMDGWCKRMQEGDTVNLEDLKKGLNLGAGLSIATTATLEQLETASEETCDVDQSADIDELLDNSRDEESELDDEPNVVEKIRQMPPTKKSRIPKATTCLPAGSIVSHLWNTTALKEGSGNVGGKPISPRKVAFVSSGARDYDQGGFATAASNENEVDSSGDIDLILSPMKQANAEQSVSDGGVHRLDHEAPLNASGSLQDRKFIRSHMLPVRERTVQRRARGASSSDDEPSTKLTVQEKLNVARAEAEAAAVAAGLRLDDLDTHFATGFEKSAKAESEPVDRVVKKRQDEPQEPAESPAKAKRTGMKGRATRRRKSTLTPQELETLMFN